MNQFKCLTPEDYERYVINPPADFAGQITWYGHPVAIDRRDRWLVLAFLQSAERPEVLTLCLCPIDDEALFYYEEDYENFDILQHPLGHWQFTKEMLDELVVMLREHGGKLVGPFRRQGASMLQRIDKKKLSDWHIPVLSVPGMESVEVYFYQTYDPLKKQDPRGFTTLVRFSRSRSYDDERLSLSLTHFPRSALQDPKYRPADKGIGCINLDRQGVDEFIELLEEQWHFLR